MIKNLNLSILLLVAALHHSLAFAMPEKDTGNLGEIRQSILSPDSFQRIYGKGWVLMDGRELRDEDDLLKEGLWQSRNIPDARGVFLRSTNHGRDSTQGNPLGDLDPGTYQADDFKSHKHIDAGHAHSLFGYEVGVHSPGGTGTAGIDVHPANNVKLASDAVKTGHADIKYSGGNETRPRAIIVNTYIKINRTTEKNIQTQSIKKAFDGLPAQLRGNDDLREWIADLIHQGLAMPTTTSKTSNIK